MEVLHKMNLRVIPDLLFGVMAMPVQEVGERAQEEADDSQIGTLTQDSAILVLERHPHFDGEVAARRENGSLALLNQFGIAR